MASRLSGGEVGLTKFDHTVTTCQAADTCHYKKS